LQNWHFILPNWHFILPNWHFILPNWHFILPNLSINIKKQKMNKYLNENENEILKFKLDEANKIIINKIKI